VTLEAFFGGSGSSKTGDLRTSPSAGSLPIKADKGRLVTSEAFFGGSGSSNTGDLRSLPSAGSLPVKADKGRLVTSEAFFGGSGSSHTDGLRSLPSAGSLPVKADKGRLVTWVAFFGGRGSRDSQALSSLLFAEDLATTVVDTVKSWSIEYAREARELVSKASMEPDEPPNRTLEGWRQDGRRSQSELLGLIDSNGECF
jgi:hypothetical protein